MPRRFPLAPWVPLQDGSQPRRFRWQLRPTYTRIHPLGRCRQWPADLAGRWGVSHSCGIGGTVQPINFTRLVTPSARHSHSWILLRIRWKLKSLFLAPSRQAHATRSKPLLVGRLRPHASERAVAATSLPCEDNAAVRTKDKPFVLTPRTHMGVFEKNGASLVLHWRGCVDEGDKPPNAKKPNGKNGCSGKQSACKSSLNNCKKQIEISLWLIQTKKYNCFFLKKN